MESIFERGSPPKGMDDSPSYANSYSDSIAETGYWLSCYESSYLSDSRAEDFTVSKSFFSYVISNQMKVNGSRSS